MTLALAAVFLTVTQTFSLPPGLLSAVCYVESKHNASSVNRDDGGSDSIGVCQLKLETAVMLGYRGSKERLLRPDVNVEWAGRYLRYQLSRYDGDVLSAISAYNVGQYRLNDSGRPVNLEYVRKVLMAWAEHK